MVIDYNILYYLGKIFLRDFLIYYCVCFWKMQKDNLKRTARTQCWTFTRCSLETCWFDWLFWFSVLEFAFLILSPYHFSTFQLNNPALFLLFDFLVCILSLASLVFCYLSCLCRVYTRRDAYLKSIQVNFDNFISWIFFPLHSSCQFCKLLKNLLCKVDFLYFSYFFPECFLRIVSIHLYLN